MTGCALMVAWAWAGAGAGAGTGGGVQADRHSHGACVHGGRGKPRHPTRCHSWLPATIVIVVIVATAVTGHHIHHRSPPASHQPQSPSATTGHHAGGSDGRPPDRHRQSHRACHGLRPVMSPPPPPGPLPTRHPASTIRPRHVTPVHTPDPALM